MLSKFFKLCKSIDDLRPFLQEKELFKCFSFGEAPSNVKAPYLVYQNVSGSPFYGINHRIDYKKLSLQVDIYANSEEQALTILKIIEEKLPNWALLARYNAYAREIDSRYYRISFDLEITETEK